MSTDAKVEGAQWAHDEDLLESGLEEYQRYLDDLDTARSHLDTLLNTTAATLDQLSAISNSFHSIDTQTAVFKKQSEVLLQDQNRNEAISRDIAENLQFYEPLEKFTRRLNAPGAGSFVRSRDFSDMLVTLDQCIDYMQTHPKHKEAETYRARYRLLLTRALTLVRNSFMGAVRETAAEVAKRIADRQLNDTTMSALLYAKFRVGAAEMKEVGLEIHKRANPPADAEPGTEGEYQSLMNELHISFAASRARLILPIVTKRLSEIAQSPSSKDLISFARSTISYVRGICLDEFDLWGEWFHGQRGLYEFLESVCEPLFDHLRPRIIHENKLSKLCQLVSLLQTRYLHDPEDDGEMPDLTQLDFGSLIQPVLEDAQTRVVFRALAMLRSDIESYKPRPDDLNYPRKKSKQGSKGSSAPLSGRRFSKDPTTPLPKEPEIVDEELDSGEEEHAWALRGQNSELHSAYPTLSKAIKLLSRIYRLVNSSIFDDLAHQIVHQTTVSLHAAASMITAKNTLADGQLFLLKHLLLLKSQIVAFDIEYVTPDVSFDFSGVTDTFYEIRDRGGLFNPRSWLRLVGGGLLPRVVENMLDAKVELDGRLRTVINDFTAGYAANMTKTLPVGTANQKPNEAASVVTKTRQSVQKEVPLLRRKLEEYLDDLKTRETLVAAVEDQVVQIYESFFDGYAGGAGNRVSRKGKGREDAVWDIDTFAEWAETVFAVVLTGDEDAAVMSTGGSRSLSRSGSS